MLSAAPLSRRASVKIYPAANLASTAPSNEINCLAGLQNLCRQFFVYERWYHDDVERVLVEPKFFIWDAWVSVDEELAIRIVDFSFNLHPVFNDPPPPPNPGTNDPHDGGSTDTGSTDPPDGGDIFPTGNTIPEPAGLGLLAVAAAFFGGLHRRRLGAGG